MGVSKVVYGDDTLMDLTGDTVTPTSLTLGATAHAANGEPIVGEYQYTLPVASPTTRGGARIQPDSGLEVVGTDNLQVRLALESDGTVRGGIAELTAKGHAEQFSTTGKQLVFKSMQGVNIDSRGLISTNNGTNYAMHVGAVTQGETYVVTTDDTANLVCGFFTTEPATGSTSYDGSRIVSDSLTFTAPITGYVAFRSNKDYPTPQLELGSTATEYEPYTGGAPSPSPDYPQEIQVVRGRNLIEVAQKASTTYQGFTYSVGTNNRLIASGTATGINTDIDFTIDSDTVLKSGETYTLSFEGIFAFSASVAVFMKGSSWTNVGNIGSGNKSLTFTLSDDIALNTVKLRVNAGTTNVDAHIQLILGSTPQPYVPYGHVGMEVRDPDTDELISCTALPLPQRGWVAGLPDGTADSLRLDGAGKCEWTLPTSKTTGEELASDSIRAWIKSGSFSGGYYLSEWASANSIPLSTNHLQTHLITANNQEEYLVGTCLFDNSLNIRLDNDTYPTVEAFKQWLASSGFELLYPLAAPVTEDCGYCEDWPTDIPDGAVLDIPELSEVGIKFFIDSAVTELAKQWYARANSEYEDRITALEQAVAELVTQG